MEKIFLNIRREFYFQVLYIKNYFHQLCKGIHVFVIELLIQFKFL